MRARENIESDGISDSFLSSSSSIDKQSRDFSQEENGFRGDRLRRARPRGCGIVLLLSAPLRSMQWPRPRLGRNAQRGGRGAASGRSVSAREAARLGNLAHADRVAI